MKIQINKREVEVAQDVTTLAIILEKMGLTGPGQAVAIGTSVVPRAKWAETPLEEGMKITVIRAVCGG